MIPFLTRIVLHNYKSIAACDVRLGALTYLVGANGAGKSSFLDALRFVADALNGSLDSAFSARWSLANLLHRSLGNSTYIGIRLEFQLPDGRRGDYAFSVQLMAGGSFSVEKEICSIVDGTARHYFHVASGTLVGTSETTFPAVAPDRLALTNASGLPSFRPVFDALSSIGVYSLNLKAMRELQQPQDGRVLKSGGENSASVLAALQEADPDQFELVQRYLHASVPTIHGVSRREVMPMETMVFKSSAGPRSVENLFFANAMSDGTLRILGVLLALYQHSATRSASVVCIEEPETALHPAAFAALREAIERASESRQIIITSHSPDLLDDLALSADAVLVVASVDGATQFSRLDEALESAINTHSFSIGELLRLNQLDSAPPIAPMRDARLPDLWDFATT